MVGASQHGWHPKTIIGVDYMRNHHIHDDITLRVCAMWSPGSSHTVLHHKANLEPLACWALKLQVYKPQQLQR
jgi:hypothetical protein